MAGRAPFRPRRATDWIDILLAGLEQLDTVLQLRIRVVRVGHVEILLHLCREGRGLTSHGRDSHAQYRGERRDTNEWLSTCRSDRCRVQPHMTSLTISTPCVSAHLSYRLFLHSQRAHGLELRKRRLRLLLEVSKLTNPAAAPSKNHSEVVSSHTSTGLWFGTQTEVRFPLSVLHPYHFGPIDLHSCFAYSLPVSLGHNVCV